MKVTLNPAEMAFAAKVGIERNKRRQDAGVTNKGTFGGAAVAEDHHIVGAKGELAFAKAYGSYPSGLFVDMDEDDDVSGIQVRTRRKDFMQLYIFKSDPMDCWYALITGVGPNFTYHGMIHTDRACVDANWVKKGANGGFPKRACWIIQHEDLVEH